MHEAAAGEHRQGRGAGAEIDAGGAEIGLVVGEAGEPGDIGRGHHGLDRDMAALDREHQIAHGGDVGGDHVHVDAEAMAEHAARLADAGRGIERVADGQRMQHGAAAAHRMAAGRGQHARHVGIADGAAGRDRYRRRSARCRAGRRRARPPRIRSAGRPRLSAMSMAWLTISSASTRSTTEPAFMPLAAVWAKPMTRTPWLRRRSTSCGVCGSSRAIMQTTLLVPMSRPATTTARRGDTGFILGVRLKRSTVMPRLPCASSCPSRRPP